MSTPAWIVAVGETESELIVVVVRRERSMIHPGEGSVDQKLFPPLRATKGMFLAMAWET